MAVRGYKVMRLIDGQIASLADSRLRFPARVGVVLEMPRMGVFVGTDRAYVLRHYSSGSPSRVVRSARGAREALVTAEFAPDDVVFGSLGDREVEVGVRRARVLRIQPLVDPEDE